jgi:hypothetical protein
MHRNRVSCVQGEVNRIATDGWEVLGRNTQATIFVKEDCSITKTVHWNKLSLVYINQEEGEGEGLPPFQALVDDAMLNSEQHASPKVHEIVTTHVGTAKTVWDASNHGIWQVRVQLNDLPGIFSNAE